jgi:hypothetical protein
MGAGKTTTGIKPWRKIGSIVAAFNDGSLIGPNEEFTACSDCWVTLRRKSGGRSMSIRTEA